MKQALMAAALVAVCGWAPVGAAESAKGKTMRVLTVGNSFSQDAARFLPDIVASAPFGDVLVLSQDGALSGCSLQRHWALAQAYARDPADPAALAYTLDGRTAGLQQVLASQPWDVVTIQQVSPDSWRAETFFPEAEELAALIREFAPGAEIVLHETWAYRVDDPWLAENRLTDRTMQRKIRDAYLAAAAKLRLRVLPVGDAYRLALDDPQWDFRIDADFAAAAAPYPTLPDEARRLHVGHFWGDADGGKRLHYDPRHSSPAGQYLGGLVWYGVLFGRDVTAVTYRPESLSAAEADTLKRAAVAAIAAIPQAATR